jgi:hypothetical protein
MAVIGFAGAIFYGSQFVKEVNSGATLPYTIPPHIKNAYRLGNNICCPWCDRFGIFTYGLLQE